MRCVYPLTALEGIKLSDEDSGYFGPAILTEVFRTFPHSQDTTVSE